jgi:hypothetical protein
MLKSGHRQDAERSQQHHGNRDRRDQGRAPTLQEHEHHDDHQDDGLDQRHHHLADRQLDEGGAVIREGVAESRREGRRAILNLLADQVGCLQGVSARRQLDAIPAPG